MRKALIAIASVAAMVSLLLIGNHQLKAADHGQQLSTAGGEADILDLYSWMQGGGNKLNLVMTVPENSFATSQQYVFHINSSAGYGMAQTETLVLCQFEARTDVDCWVGAAGSTAGGEGFQTAVSGDASDATNPLQDAESDPSLRVFAGSRNDGFFFNGAGFQAVVDAVHTNAAGLTFDANSCPNNIDLALGAGTTAGLVTQLGTAVGGGTAVDSFAGGNVDALVIQVDKSLVNSGGDILGVWASTRTR